MKLTSLALAGALVLTGAGASYAQPAPAAASPEAGGRQWQRPDPAQIAERRAQHLRDTLQLRPDQEPALRALIGSMQRPEGAGGGWRGRHGGERGEMARLTTPERLDRMQQRMSERQAQFARRAEATKRFYAQLSPAQQRAFDALHQGRGGHGMRHGHGERGRG